MLLDRGGGGEVSINFKNGKALKRLKGPSDVGQKVV